MENKVEEKIQKISLLLKTDVKKPSNQVLGHQKYQKKIKKIFFF